MRSCRLPASFERKRDHLVERLDVALIKAHPVWSCGQWTVENRAIENGCAQADSLIILTDLTGRERDDDRMISLKSSSHAQLGGFDATVLYVVPVRLRYATIGTPCALVQT